MLVQMGFTLAQAHKFAEILAQNDDNALAQIGTYAESEWIMTAFKAAKTAYKVYRRIKTARAAFRRIRWLRNRKRARMAAHRRRMLALRRRREAQRRARIARIRR